MSSFLRMLAAVLLLGPFAVAAWLAVTTPDGAITVANIQKALQQGGLLRALATSGAVAAAVALLQVAALAPVAWWLARSSGRMAAGLRIALWAAILLPMEAAFVPLFEITAKLGLYNSLLGVVLPQAAAAFQVFFLESAFRAVPRSLLEAARLDGLSEAATFQQIAIPLARPALASAAVLGFLGSYGSFLWPLVVLRDGDLHTVPVALAQLTGQFSADLRALAAGALLAVIPSTVLYLIAQSSVRAGLDQGAVKG